MSRRTILLGLAPVLAVAACLRTDGGATAGGGAAAAKAGGGGTRTRGPGEGGGHAVGKEARGHPEDQRIRRRVDADRGQGAGHGLPLRLVETADGGRARGGQDRKGK